MKTIAELRADAEKALARQDELVSAAQSAGRELSAEERAEYDACSKTFDARVADIEAETARAARGDRLARAAGAAETVTRDVGGNVAALSRGATGSPRIEVKDDLTPQQRVGMYAWCAAKQKHTPASDPYQWLDAAGYQRLGDEGRQCARTFEAQTKALVTISGAGANVVHTPLSSEFIEFLRNSSAFLSGNPQQIDMGTGLEIAGGSVGAAGTYQAEGASIGYSQMTTRKVSMSPKHIRAVTAVNNFLIETSPLAVAQIAGEDLLSGIQVGIDAAGLRGDGTGDNPTGVRSLVNASHVFAEASGATAPTLAQVTAALKSILQKARASNVPERRRRWIMSSRVFTLVQFVQDGNGNYAFPGMWQPSPLLLGYPVTMSEQVPSNLGVGTNESEIYLIDFGHVLMGISRSLRLTTSVEASYVNAAAQLTSAFDKDETVIRAMAAHDFDTRHDKCAVVMTGVKWA